MKNAQKSYALKCPTNDFLGVGGPFWWCFQLFIFDRLSCSAESITHTPSPQFVRPCGAPKWLLGLEQARAYRIEMNVIARSFEVGHSLTIPIFSARSKFLTVLLHQLICVDIITFRLKFLHQLKPPVAMLIKFLVKNACKIRRMLEIVCFPI